MASSSDLSERWRASFIHFVLPGFLRWKRPAVRFRGNTVHMSDSVHAWTPNSRLVCCYDKSWFSVPVRLCSSRPACPSTPAHPLVSLSPSGMPSFIKSPDDQTGISGGVASFVCQAVGDPRPRITWMKKGKKVSSQRFEVEFG